MKKYLAAVCLIQVITCTAGADEAAGKSGSEPVASSWGFARAPEGALVIAELEVVDGKLTCNRDKFAK